MIQQQDNSKHHANLGKIKLTKLEHTSIILTSS